METKEGGIFVAEEQTRLILTVVDLKKTQFHFIFNKTFSSMTYYVPLLDSNSIRRGFRPYVSILAV